MEKRVPGGIDNLGVLPDLVVGVVWEGRFSEERKNSVLRRFKK